LDNKWIVIVPLHIEIKQVIFQTNNLHDLYMNKTPPTIIEYSVQQNIDDSSASIKKVVIKNQKRKLVSDRVIVEQPLQITLVWVNHHDDNLSEHSQVFSITMRTPGNDRQLILGLLMSEGVIDSFEDIADISPNSTDSNNNLWEVTLSKGLIPELSSLERYQMTYSSCGLCGTTSLKSLELKDPPILSETKHILSIADVLLMSGMMKKQQSLFKVTGSSHAAGLFSGNCLLDIREDIGRHNAVDKLFGALLESRSCEPTNIPEHLACLVSSRVSFEIVQKSVMAGIAILIAVGAPSDLAISAAKRFNLTLIGFTSENGFNVYHGEWRLQPLEP
jgi:FdhD protein